LIPKRNTFASVVETLIAGLSDGAIEVPRRGPSSTLAARVELALRTAWGSPVVIGDRASTDRALAIPLTPELCQYFDWSDRFEDLLEIARELRPRPEPARLRDLLSLLGVRYSRVLASGLLIAGPLEKVVRVAEVLEAALAEHLEPTEALALQLELSIVEALGETVLQIREGMSQAIQELRRRQLSYSEAERLQEAFNAALEPALARLRATASALEMAVDRATAPGERRALHAGQSAWRE
jgi:hypothetical protein